MEPLRPAHLAHRPSATEEAGSRPGSRQILQRILPATALPWPLHPMRRAITHVISRGYQAEIEDDLREWDYRLLRGLTSGDIQKSVPGWHHLTGPVPGGEPSRRSAHARIASWGSAACGFGRCSLCSGTVICCVCWPARWLRTCARGRTLLGLTPRPSAALGWSTPRA